MLTHFLSYIPVNSQSFCTACHASSQPIILHVQVPFIDRNLATGTFWFRVNWFFLNCDKKRKIKCYTARRYFYVLVTLSGNCGFQWNRFSNNCRAGISHIALIHNDIWIWNKAHFKPNSALSCSQDKTGPTILSYIKPVVLKGFKSWRKFNFSFQWVGCCFDAFRWYLLRYLCCRGTMNKSC